MAKPNITESATTALANANHPSELLSNAGIDLFEDAQQLGSDFAANDMQVPFLVMLQSNSPQVKKSDAKYVNGAQEGDILAVATKKVYKLDQAPLIVIPVHYRKTYVEWILKDEGGGFIADHGPDAGAKLYAQCVKDAKGKYIVPGTDGKHQLVETMQYALLYIDDEKQPQQGILSFTSTQLKKGRAWNTAMDSVRIDNPKQPGTKLKPPVFYKAYAITGIAEKNDVGSWVGYKIDPLCDTISIEGVDGVAAYKLARELKQLVLEGAFNLETASAAEATTTASASSSTEAPANGGGDYASASQGNGAF